MTVSQLHKTLYRLSVLTGPEFAYAPPLLQDIAEARPVSDLASEKLPAPAASDSPGPDNTMQIVAA